MSTKTTMTTRARALAPYQNLNIHNQGGAANGSKAQQKPGVSIRKALANITNSEKPHFHQESKKKQLKEYENKEVSIAVEEEQSCTSVRAKTSTQQLLNKMPPLDGERAVVRKPLANITNSERPSVHQESKKKQLKKCSNKEVPIVIEDEQCQHNHQCCISLQRKTSSNHLLNTILSPDDEKEPPLELWSPKTPSTLLNQSKVDYTSSPRFLDFTKSPVSLKVRSSILH